MGRPQMHSVLLQTKALSLRTDERVLLLQLDWQVRAGECWCIIGCNGVGKSTLLRTLAGMRAMDGGEIFLRDQAIETWALKDLAKERSFLPQSRIDAFAYTAMETVLSARHPYQDTHYWESSDDLEMAVKVLRQLDVENLAQRDVRSLSGGERQRVAIAALLAQDTHLMLLDEPANSLDLGHQVSVMQLLENACLHHDKAVIMVSHDLNLSYRIATHALLMMQDGAYLYGEKAQVMTTDNLSNCLGHAILGFAHDGQMVFLPKFSRSELPSS